MARPTAEQPIWVVDDREDVAMAVAKPLITCDLPSLSFVHGQEVMLRLVNEQPPLMLLDLRMPKNGNVLLDEICKHSEWTFPIIILTGVDDTLRDELRVRVFACVAKSADPLEIVNCCERALGLVPESP